MAYQFLTNQTPATGAEAMLLIKDFLVSSGAMKVMWCGMGTNVDLGPKAAWTANTVATLSAAAAGDGGKTVRVYGFSHTAAGPVSEMLWTFEDVVLNGGGDVSTVKKWDCVSGAVLAVGVLDGTLTVKCGVTSIYVCAAGLTGRRVDELTTAVAMANGTCWFVLESMDGGYQLCLLRNASNQNWSSWYSTKTLNGAVSGGGFNDNLAFTADYNTSPLAYDSQVLGTGNSLFHTDNIYMLHVLADSVAPHGWAFFTTIKVTGASSGGMFHDPLLAGSYSTDPDPRVMGIFTQGNGWVYDTPHFYNGGVNQYGPQGWLKKGIAGAAWCTTKALWLKSTGGDCFPYQSGVGASVDPMTGKEVLIPVMYCKSSSEGGTFGWKGVSTLHKWCGTNRGNNDTLSVAGPATMEYIYLTSGLVLPWDGVTIPVW